MNRHMLLDRTYHEICLALRTNRTEQIAVNEQKHIQGMKGSPLVPVHKRMPEKIGTGWYFGFCLTYIFTFRFFIEYTKEIQEAFEASLPIDMGQILSIPFIILGTYCMIKAKKKA